MDLNAIASIATAGGTLVLAVATFSSVRSANAAARTAERAFQANLRPVLVPSRLGDTAQKIRWVDDHWSHVGGGRASVEVGDGVIYMAMSLRNVGSGIGVLHGWWADGSVVTGGARPADQSEFRHQTRDLYVPPSDTGFWQAAIRDTEDGLFDVLAKVIHDRRTFTVDLLYGDHEGGQRTVTRFAIAAMGDADAEDGGWLASAALHWSLDRADPRHPDSSSPGG